MPRYFFIGEKCDSQLTGMLLILNEQNLHEYSLLLKDLS